MYVAICNDYAFKGKTQEEVIKNAMDSSADYDEMNFLNWEWFKATPCTVKLELTPKVEEPAPKDQVKK